VSPVKKCKIYDPNQPIVPGVVFSLNFILRKYTGKMQEEDDSILSSTRLADTSVASLTLNTSRSRAGAAASFSAPEVGATGHSSKLIQSLCVTPLKHAGERKVASANDVMARLHLARNSPQIWKSGLPPPTLVSPARFKSPSRLSGTPSKPRTPSADRFIPNRSSTDYERAHFMLTRAGKDLENTDQLSPSQRNRQARVKQLFGQDAPDGRRMFAYKDHRLTTTLNRKDAILQTLPIESLVNTSRNLGTGVSNKAARKISQVPERILDAPEIINDYYLNPIDWSAGNLLAVALANHLYIWNANTGEVSPLAVLPESDYVCSVKWVPGDVDGSTLAVGLSTGNIMLWNVQEEKKLRTLKGHTDRVAALSWNEHLLTSGGRSGEIRHSDVRTRDHLVGKVKGHQREVCGLAWSPDGKTLASGSNDNLVKLWTMNQPNGPKATFSDHKAAVKALAWCPWQNNLLATGAGTADRAIKIWNCNTQTLVKSVDTKSQVCSVVWSANCHEIASSHGFPSNGVVVWKYPDMSRLAELNGHTDRVLALSLSNDGTTLVSAGADETLQLWKCFPQKENPKSTHIASNKKSDQFKKINRAGIR